MNTITTLDATSVLDDLKEEIDWLNELAALSTAAREAAMAQGTAELTNILETKTILAARLSARHEARSAMLRDGGHGNDDLLVFLLGLVDKEGHAGVIELLNAYVEAQNASRRTVADTRAFFDVALNMVTEMRRSLSVVDDVTTYDRGGVRGATVIPLSLSQLV